MCPFQPRYKRRDQVNEVGTGKSYTVKLLLAFLTVTFGNLNMNLCASNGA